MLLLGLNSQQLTSRLPVSDLRFAIAKSQRQYPLDVVEDSHDGAFVNSDYLTDALERITQHQQTEKDLEMLRRSLRLADSVVQSVSQDGKFNTNVGQFIRGEVHIGDSFATARSAERIYHGVDVNLRRWWRSDSTEECVRLLW